MSKEMRVLELRIESLKSDFSAKETECERLRELSNVYADYSQLLIDELNDFAGIAFVHGIRSTRVEAGKQARERIAKIKTALEPPKEQEK
jgi:hypothetical protein